MPNSHPGLGERLPSHPAWRRPLQCPRTGLHPGTRRRSLSPETDLRSPRSLSHCRPSWSSSGNTSWAFLESTSLCLARRRSSLDDALRVRTPHLHMSQVLAQWLVHWLPSPETLKRKEKKRKMRLVYFTPYHHIPQTAAFLKNIF